MSRPTARDKILAAAADVAREHGAGNLSLDAVAAKAGVSKGGLLYHFPTKAALMRASVAFFVDDFEKRLDAASDGQAGLMNAFVGLTLQDCARPEPGKVSLLAAMADDPDLLLPVKVFQRRLLDRLLAEAPDPGRALLIYLALEGLRSQHLFDMDVLTDQEVATAQGEMLNSVQEED